MKRILARVLAVAILPGLVLRMVFGSSISAGLSADALATLGIVLMVVYTAAADLLGNALGFPMFYGAFTYAIVCLIATYLDDRFGLYPNPEGGVNYTPRRLRIVATYWPRKILNHWYEVLWISIATVIVYLGRVPIMAGLWIWGWEMPRLVFWWSVDIGAAAYRNSFLMSLVALVGWLIVWYYSRLLNKYHQRTKLVNEKLQLVEKDFRASHERLRSLLAAFEALRRDIDEQRGRKSSPIAQEIRESLEDILESHGGIPKDLLFESSVQVIQLEIKACRQVRERRRRVRGNIRTQRRIDEHNRSRRT